MPSGEVVVADSAAVTAVVVVVVEGRGDEAPITQYLGLISALRQRSMILRRRRAFSKFLIILLRTMQNT